MEDQKTDSLQVLKDLKIKQLITLSVIIWVACWSAWNFLGREVFEVGQSFAIFGFVSALYLKFPNWKISKISLVVACNQLVDEILFDPFKIEINEYLAIISIAIIVILNPKT